MQLVFQFAQPGRRHLVRGCCSGQGTFLEATDLLFQRCLSRLEATHFGTISLEERIDTICERPHRVLAGSDQGRCRVLARGELKRIAITGSDRGRCRVLARGELKRIAIAGSDRGGCRGELNCITIAGTNRGRCRACGDTLSLHPELGAPRSCAASLNVPSRASSMDSKHDRSLTRKTCFLRSGRPRL